MNKPVRKRFEQETKDLLKKWPLRLEKLPLMKGSPGLWLKAQPKEGTAVCPEIWPPGCDSTKTSDAAFNKKVRGAFATRPDGMWLCVYVLVAIVRKELRLELSLSPILQILSINAFEQVPLAELIEKTRNQNNLAVNRNQLMLWH